MRSRTTSARQTGSVDLNEDRGADLISGQDASASQVLENSSILAKRAILVFPNLRAWTGKVKDVEDSKEYNETHGISDKDHEAEVYQNLLPAMASKIRKPLDKMRNRHYQLTLPYTIDGWCLLPSAMYWDYMKEMRKHEQEFQKQLEKHLALYDEYMAEERREKNGAFRPELYPTKEEIRAKYSVNFHFKPVPQAGDWIVDIEREEIEKLKISVAAQQSMELEVAMRKNWARLHEVVKKMIEGLDRHGKKKPGAKKISTFRDTLVENIEELVDFLPKMNLTGDADLAKLTDEVRDKLTRYSGEELREEPEKNN